jgi:cytochrome c556
LERALRASVVEPMAVAAAFTGVLADCRTCHERFRDVPLSEKRAARAAR